MQEAFNQAENPASAAFTLGIDTSNYTTSAAVYSDGGYQSSRKLLLVPKGECGLRQSDAVFAHVKNFGEVFAKLDLDAAKISAVGVSERPRSVEGSYMPCFMYGLSVAEALAKALGVPLFKYSHQQGHIAAAVLSCGKKELLNEPFYCFHVSGGTTELLRVNGIDSIEIAGKTEDISVGQLIDRIGVHLGFDFPAGVYLEQCAAEGNISKRQKITLKNGNCNLSGYENKAKQLLDTGMSRSDVSRWVLAVASDTIKEMTKAANKEGLPVVYAGGVMADKIIRDELAGENVYFASTELSGDNAVGIAYLTHTDLKK